MKIVFTLKVKNFIIYFIMCSTALLGLRDLD